MFSFLNKAAETVRAHTTEFVEEFVKETLEIKQELTKRSANDGEETSSASTGHRAKTKSVTSTAHLPEQFQAKLDALKRKEDTFTVEVSQEGLLAFPFTDDEVAEWEADEVIQAAYQRLVPSQVERDVFWRRFLARLHLLKKDEANLTQIMNKHAAEEDEDVGWGSDEEQVLFDADEADRDPTLGASNVVSRDKDASADVASVSAPASCSGETAEKTDLPMDTGVINASATETVVLIAKAEAFAAGAVSESPAADTVPASTALTPTVAPASTSFPSLRPEGSASVPHPGPCGSAHIPPPVTAVSSAPAPVPAVADTLPPLPLSPPRPSKESEDTWGDWD